MKQGREERFTFGPQFLRVSDHQDGEIQQGSSVHSNRSMYVVQAAYIMTSQEAESKAEVRAQE